MIPKEMEPLPGYPLMRELWGAEKRTDGAYRTYEGEPAAAGNGTDATDDGDAATRRAKLLSGARGLRHNDIMVLAVGRRVLAAVGDWLTPGPEGGLEALWDLVAKLRADVRDLERLAAEREVIVSPALRGMEGDGI